MKIPDTIVQIDKDKKNPLRAISREVTKEEFGSVFLRDVIRSMTEALARESDGVAIAAPQIGIPLRLFVVADAAYNEDIKNRPLVFINPTIKKRSKKMAIMQEGCLSVRWIYGKTNRSLLATVEAYDVDGRKFSYGGSGLLAHIFQHEVDHLDGILFIDHGFDFEQYTEAEVKASAKKKANKEE
jgi:peptide deformylase